MYRHQDDVDPIATYPLFISTGMGANKEADTPWYAQYLFPVYNAVAQAPDTLSRSFDALWRGDIFNANTAQNQVTASSTKTVGTPPKFAYGNQINMPKNRTVASNPSTTASAANPSPALSVDMGGPNNEYIWSRVSDLKSFGLLSKEDEAILTSLIGQGKIKEAFKVLQDREKKVQGGSSFFDNFNLNGETIKGIPNYALYGGVGLFGVLVLSSILRKR